MTPLADRMRLPFAAVAFASVVALIPGVYVFRMAEGFLRLAVRGQPHPRKWFRARWRTASRHS
jgi:hypothetical protein